VLVLRRVVPRPVAFFAVLPRLDAARDLDAPDVERAREAPVVLRAREVAVVLRARDVPVVEGDRDVPLVLRARDVPDVERARDAPVVFRVDVPVVERERDVPDVEREREVPADPRELVVFLARVPVDFFAVVERVRLVVERDEPRDAPDLARVVPVVERERVPVVERRGDAARARETVSSVTASSPTVSMPKRSGINPDMSGDSSK
jgi:hypothetical protein